jgi:hypothetical protein
MCALILNKTFLNQLPGRCNHRRRLKLQSSLHAQRHYIGFLLGANKLSSQQPGKRYSRTMCPMDRAVSDDMRDEDAAGPLAGHLRLLWCGKLI